MVMLVILDLQLQMEPLLIYLRINFKTLLRQLNLDSMDRELQVVLEHLVLMILHLMAPPPSPLNSPGSMPS